MGGSNSKPSPSSTSQSETTCPVSRTAKEPQGCPVKHTKSGAYKNPSVYNVYSTKIDPTNQMPENPNQKPAPNQQAPLSVNRVNSTIPKGGTDTETWTYPSPQMFWNALVRKGKTEGASEEDMDTVIAIHNNMNENTWRQVMEWEKIRVNAVDSHSQTESGKEPKLLKFCGRPDELSPKARLKMLFGHPAPFDRHDWTVDRGGEEVRYIIDYYHDESAVQQDRKPKHLADAASMQSIQVDVRPAIDSVSALADRLFFMPARQWNGLSELRTPPFFAPAPMVKAEAGKEDRIKAQWADIESKCAAKKDKLHGCSSEEECRAASVALQLCTAGIVCPSVAAEFEACTASMRSASGGAGKKRSSDHNGEAEMQKAGAAYTAMVQCLEIFEMDTKKLMEKASQK